MVFNMLKIKCILFIFLLLAGARTAPAQEAPPEPTEFTDDILYTEPVDFGDQPGPQALEIVITLWGSEEDGQSIELSIEKTPSFITNPSWSTGSSVSFKANEFEKTTTLNFDLGPGPKLEKRKSGKEKMDSEDLVIVLKASSKEIIPRQRRIVLPIKTPPQEENDDEIPEQGVDPSGQGKQPESVGPPVLYLSSIEGPTPISNSKVTVKFEENVARYLYVSKLAQAGFSNDRRTTSKSLVLTEFPKKIFLGEDFAIAAEKRTQIEEEPGYCGGDNSGPGIMSRYSTSVHSTINMAEALSVKIQTTKESPNNVPCEMRGEKTKTHPGFKVGNEISTKISCVFSNVQTKNDLDFNYFYQCSTDTTGETYVRSNELKFRYSKTFGGITEKKSFALGWQKALHLNYKGKKSEQGENATKKFQLGKAKSNEQKFQTGEHYFEVVNEIGRFDKASPSSEGTGSDGSDGKGRDPSRVAPTPGGSNVAGGGGGVGAGGSGSGHSDGVERDPSKLDPSDPDIAALIKQWLAIAEPPKNAQGANFRYTKWGSWEGRGTNGKTVRVGRPAAAAGMTAVVYVWSIRNTLDSIDHCKLEEYIMARLANESIDHCRGRYKKSPGIQVANVVGLPGEKAKAILKDLGLEATFSMGKPATSKAQAFTVARQDHAPSKRVAPGTVVKLTLYDNFKSLIKVPLVAGLPNTNARNRLLAAGFEVEVKPVGKATEAKNAFTVKDTTPRANTKVKQGSLVVINTYGSFDDSVFMPNVVGLTWFDARKKLDSMGINSWSAKGADAPRKKLENTVTKQSPAEGIKVTSRTKVELTHYGEYRKSQQQQVADMKCSVPNSEAFWNQAKSAPGCKCRSGYTAAKGGKSCQRITPVVPKKEPSNSLVGNGWTPLGNLNRLCVAELSCGGKLPVCDATTAGKVIQDRRSHNGCIAQGCEKGTQFTHKTFVCRAPPSSKRPGVEPTKTGNLACLCKGGDAYNRNDKTCDSPYSPANIFGGKSDTAYPSGSYPFTNKCSYPIKTGKGSKKLPANAYVIDKIEIPKASYQTTGSVICEVQISNGSRVKRCKHHKDEGLLKLQIQHNFRLRAERGNTFVPGEKVYLEISGSISGHSTCCSIGGYVASRFEPGGGRFKTESKSGDGDGWAMNNSDLPQIGRERRGSASMRLIRVATFPDTKGKPAKIVLTGSNGSSLVIYHLKPAR